MHRMAFALAFVSACTLEALPARDVTSTNDATADGTQSDVANDVPADTGTDTPVTDTGTDTPGADAPVDAPTCTVSSLMCPRLAADAVPGCMYGRCNSASDCGSLGAPWGCATPDGVNSIVPGIGIPGGMCSRSCGSDSQCPCGMNCLFVHGHDGTDLFMCLPGCTQNSDCLPGWRCAEDTLTPPTRWCAPACAAAADCPMGRQCDTVRGTCY